MTAKASFKKIGIRGNKNMQQVIHNYSGDCKMAEVLCNTIEELRVSIHLLLRDKRKLTAALMQTKEELHRVKLEQAHHRFPLIHLKKEEAA